MNRSIPLSLDEMNREWEAWQGIITAIAELQNVPRKEINADKYKPLIRAIDVWGNELAKLRIVQRQNGQFDALMKDGTMFSHHDEPTDVMGKKMVTAPDSVDFKKGR